MAEKGGIKGDMVDFSQQYTDNGASNVTVPNIGRTFGSPVEADNDNGVSNVTVPKVGMTFGSPDEAFQFYRDYSCKVGFGITKRTSHKSHGIAYDVTFSCHKCRKPKKIPEECNANRTRGVLSTGCQAHIFLKNHLPSGSWSIERVVLEHNHELSPNSLRLMSCCRQLPLFLKKQPEINGLVGLAQSKSITAVFTQAEGITKCHFSETTRAKPLVPNKALCEKDIRNHVMEIRWLVLQEEDAAALKKHFNEQQLLCPNFFYSYDIDDDCRLKNVFWADARSRSAFKYFSDVITFDTTCLMNRYRMPFVVFSGINHHGQNILLGCALLANELKETYVWLFKTLLDCMHGKAPGAMVTNQCEAIYGALTEVFPNTRHRLCLWHIVKKVPEKLAGCNQRDQVMQLIHNAVYDSETHEEFEHIWCSIVNDFQLGNHRDWFVNLYDIRHKWVPVFVKHQFWAGISTIQQSESMNAFFDGYINSRTSLKTFLQKYNSVLHSKWEKERQEEFRCMDTKPKLFSEFGFEAQIAKAYTLKLFYQFQREIKMLISCCCEIFETRNASKKFIVFEVPTDQKHTVTYCTENSEYLCDCLMFQFRGIVCRHALCVYRQMRVDYIPQCYIMNRWRKDYIISHIKQTIPQQPFIQELPTYNALYATVNDIVQDLIEIASCSKTLNNVLISGLIALRQQLLDQMAETEEPAQCTNGTTNQAPDQQYLSEQMEDPILKDPLIVQSKVRPRSSQYKPSSEMPSSNKRRCDGQTKQNNQKNKSKSTAGTPVETPDQFASDIELLMHFHTHSSMEQC